MPKSTPAPWVAREYGSSTYVYPDNGDPDAAPIALVDSDNQAGDLALIAAAPDLLAACKTAVTLDLITDPDERRRVVLQLMEAIAKAEQESP